MAFELCDKNVSHGLTMRKLGSDIFVRCVAEAAPRAGGLNPRTNYLAGAPLRTL